MNELYHYGKKGSHWSPEALARRRAYWNIHRKTDDDDTKNDDDTLGYAIRKAIKPANRGISAGVGDLGFAKRYPGTPSRLGKHFTALIGKSRLSSAAREGSKGGRDAIINKYGKASSGMGSRYEKYLGKKKLLSNIGRNPREEARYRFSSRLVKGRPKRK